jgi:RHS repeat-associated protein
MALRASAKVAKCVAGVYYAEYTYTQRNQLASIPGVCTFTYDPSGNMTSRTGQWYYTNATNFTYDDLNRVTEGEQQPMNWTSHYGYDSNNRETGTWRDEQSGKGEHFGYNASGQLTSASYNADQAGTNTPLNATRTVSYNVDALNRQSVNDNGTVTSYTPDGLNQYTGIGSQSPQYDGNFSLTSYSGASFNYNAAKQLVSASNGGNSLQFTYDGLGRCVRRTINGTSRLFSYDGWNAILEWDGGGNLAAWNIYGARADEILARWDSGVGPLIYKQDKQGNVVALLSYTGSVLEKYTYDAFGQPTVTNSDGSNSRTGSYYGNRFMFTGREYFPELGVYDYRNRFYHPGLGRFLQSDPMGFAAGDANLYRYCGGDPVNHSDPSGLESPDAIKSVDGNTDSNNPNGPSGYWETPAGQAELASMSTTGPVDVHSTELPSGKRDLNSLDHSGGASGEGHTGDGFGLANDLNNAFRQLARYNNRHAAEIRSRLEFANFLNRAAWVPAAGVAIPVAISFLPATSLQSVQALSLSSLTSTFQAASLSTIMYTGEITEATIGLAEGIEPTAEIIEFSVQETAPSASESLIESAGQGFPGGG